MEEKEEKRRWQGLYRAMFLTAMLLLLQVKGGKTLKGSSSLDGDKSKKDSKNKNVEQYVEKFVVSSVGDMWQEEDMAQQEDIVSHATTIRDHLFDLAFCFNLASIVFFL